MAIHPIDALEVCLRQTEVQLDRVFPASTADHLPSLVELLALRWTMWKEQESDLFEGFPGLAALAPLRKLQDLAPGVTLLQLLGESASGGTAVAVWDRGAILEIPHELREWESGQPFSLAQEEICRVLTESGVPRTFSLALIGAIGELASNAVEHSGSDAPPLLSFQVSKGEWSFGITDVGQGVRASLGRNPEYRDLRSDQAALRLALQEGVSATNEADRGHGFRNVFKALVDHRVDLRFRSGGAVGTWGGVSPTSQTIQTSSLPLSRGGFHVELSGKCATQG